ncbi:MAG: peptidylprolyl isomerase [Planctomycetota bacterium]
MHARWISILGLAILLQGVAGCTQDDDAPQDDNMERHKAGDLLGDYALDGAGHFRIRTSELASRVLLIHFFDSDSDACRGQVERVRKLWFPLRAAGMSVLGVCPETPAKEIRRTVADWNLPYPVFLDRQRKFTREFAPRKYPWNVVVGRDGRILYTGNEDWAAVQSAVKDAVQVKVEGPDRVCVQHILIAFEGSVPGKKIERSKGDAATLAAGVLKRAKGGEEFGKLLKDYSSDTRYRVHRLTNFGVEPDDDLDESERGIVAQSFGDVAFSLEIGEIGMAEHHPMKSRSGWHIIKRLE